MSVRRVVRSRSTILMSATGARRIANFSRAYNNNNDTDRRRRRITTGRAAIVFTGPGMYRGYRVNTSPPSLHLHCYDARVSDACVRACAQDVISDNFPTSPVYRRVDTRKREKCTSCEPYARINTSIHDIYTHLKIGYTLELLGPVRQFTCFFPKYMYILFLFFCFFFRRSCARHIRGPSS